MPDFQTIAAVVFLVALTIFVFLKRKNLETKQLVPYFLYFSMYKTKAGLKLMDSWAKKYKKLLLFIGYAGILVGFLGMALISYSLVKNIFILFTKPEAAPGVGLVLPFKAKGIFFVPFFYWIISIFVIAVVHEFAHGVIARTHRLKVKSSGFAFLALVIPIIPAAFVEPDEKELKKRPHKEQLSVFAAGPFANIAAAFLFLGIASFLLAPIARAMIEPNGVRITDYVKENGPFPAETYGVKINEVIREVDGTPTPYVNNLSAVLRSKKPNDIVTIKTDKSEYKIKLAKNPENESIAYIGAFLEQSTKINENVTEKYGKFLPNVLIWVLGLLVILYVLNFGIGLFNLVPIGPLDGGRMLQLVLYRIFDEKKANKIFVYVGLFFLAIIFFNIAIGFVR
ncbi:site-2 protease family protein [Candidatus Woesearchaeota archaeon]|nr:site-2 protease family protein [Candidatus Woesearchaeota archaeon]